TGRPANCQGAGPAADAQGALELEIRNSNSKIWISTLFRKSIFESRIFIVHFPSAADLAAGQSCGVSCGGTRIRSSFSGCRAWRRSQKPPSPRNRFPRPDYSGRIGEFRAGFLIAPPESPPGTADTHVSQSPSFPPGLGALYLLHQGIRRRGTGFAGFTTSHQ